MLASKDELISLSSDDQDLWEESGSSDWPRIVGRPVLGLRPHPVAGAVLGNGIVNQKVDPPPAGLARQPRSPPMSSARRREMARPSPVPPKRRVADPVGLREGPRPAAARRPGSSPRRRCRRPRSAAPRGPGRGRRPVRRSVTTTSPASVNFTALSTRLSSTWRRRAGSATTSSARGRDANAIGSPCAWARAASSPPHLLASGRTSTSPKSSSSLPASIFEKSRMSSMTVSSACPSGAAPRGPLPGVQPASSRSWRHAEHAGHRRADLVAHVRHEFRLEARGAHRLVAGRAQLRRCAPRTVASSRLLASVSRSSRSWLASRSRCCSILVCTTLISSAGRDRLGEVVVHQPHSGDRGVGGDETGQQHDRQQRALRLERRSELQPRGVGQSLVQQDEVGTVRFAPRGSLAR